MDKFKLVSKILDETMNCSAALNAYESPARPWKNEKKSDVKDEMKKMADKLKGKDE